MDKLSNFVLRAFALAAIWLVSGGCSGNMPMTPAPPPPPPSIRQFSPTLVARSPGGSVSFTLFVDGENCDSGSVITWNGASHSTQFIDPSHLTAFIDVPDVNQVLSTPCGATAICLVTIDVVNSAGVHSNAVTLKIFVEPMI